MPIGGLPSIPMPLSKFIPNPKGTYRIGEFDENGRPAPADLG